MPEGFLLIDSGGQYLFGTTDITRTVAVGALTDAMKKDYTLVLKRFKDHVCQVSFFNHEPQK